LLEQDGNPDPIKKLPIVYIIPLTQFMPVSVTWKITVISKSTALWSTIKKLEKT